MSPPPVSAEEDVDSTAELPTLDVAASAAARPAKHDGGDDHHTRTDTWVLPQPAVVGGEQLREFEAQQQTLLATVQSLTEELRESRELLRGKDERLRQVEQVRDETQAAHAAAATRLASLSAELEAQRRGDASAAASTTVADAGASERLATLGAQLEQQRSEASRQAEQLEQATGTHAAAEQRLSALQVELEQRQVVVTQLTAQAEELAQAHAQAELRVTALGAELQSERAAGAQRAEQLQQSVRTQADDARRAQETAAQLAQLRAEHTAAQERGAQLQRELADQSRASQARQSQQLELHQAEAARGRAHAEQALRQLHEERNRSAGYLESLSSLEARRCMVEQLVIDMDQSGSSLESELLGVRRELSAREARMGELASELSERDTRLARLEQQLSTFKETLAQRDTQLRDAHREGAGLQASVTRLQGELAQSGERLRALEDRSEQQRANDAQQQDELRRLRTESRELRSALESARAGAASASSQASSQDSALSQAQSALHAERERATQLESELATVRGEMEDWGGVLRTAQNHLSAVAEAEARTRRLEAELAQQREAARGLQAQADGHAARVLELQSDLQSAAGNLSRLEQEARQRSARLEELEQAQQLWRGAAAEMRHASTDTANTPALREAARALAADPDATEVAPALDGEIRVLIHGEGEHEIVHVLGRKTSIGRTPDNDLQLDTKFVSRHHAVILVGPTHTIIEDLNSTNGVVVNGRKVTRHTLQEGDTVAIGRAQYRFAIRRSSDKR
jgi:chromosome segregation ATPase